MCDFPCTSFRWKPKSHDDFVVCNCDGSIRWYNRIQDSPYGHYERNDISYLCSDYQCNEDWSVFGTDKDTLEIFDNLTMKPTCVNIFLQRFIKLEGFLPLKSITTSTESSVSSVFLKIQMSSLAEDGIQLYKYGISELEMVQLEKFMDHQYHLIV